MNCGISLNENTSFSLQDALLVYRTSPSVSGREPNSVFVTHHGIVPVDDGAPILGEAKPLTEGFLRELCKGLQESMETEILPESVLAYGDGTIAWWRPAGPATMFFAQGTMASHLSGREVPLPPLVFLVKQQQMSVAALQENKRPTASTPLFRAPFWNVYDDGSLCHGSMNNPGSALAASITEWEEAFFSSGFTHPNYHEQAIQHERGMVGAWEEAMATGTFQPHWLVGLDRSLSTFVKDAR